MTNKQFTLLIGTIVAVGFMTSLALALNGRYQLTPRMATGGSPILTDTWTGKMFKIGVEGQIPVRNIVREIN